MESILEKKPFSQKLRDYGRFGDLPDETPEESQKKFFLISMGVLMSGGGIMWGSICTTFSLHYQSLIPYGYTILTIFNLLFFAATKNFKAVRFVQVLMSLLLPFLFQWSLGGFVSSGAVMVWSMLALVGSFTFQQASLSLRWLIVYLLFTIAAGFIDPVVRPFGITVSENITTSFFVANIVTVSAIVVGLMIYLLNEREKSNLSLAGALTNLMSSQKELQLSEKKLEETNRNLELKVEERTKDLSNTLEELKSTQDKLILNEKMAALGQIIAGVAHEINTPLGAIRASNENISAALGETTKNLPKLSSMLSEPDFNYFFDLLERSLQSKSNISAREERQFRKQMTSFLESNGFENAQQLSEDLSDLQIYENLEPYLDFLRSKNAQFILRLIYNLSTQKKNSSNIATAVERASKIVFALKKTAYHTEEGSVSKTDIIDSLETILTLYTNQLKQGVEVVKNFAQIPQIDCYRDELSQVWTNLLHNSLQAMNNRGQIMLEVFDRDGHVHVNFIDNGPGIPDHIVGKIFDPFFTTKKKGEGSGLGLDICRKIIEKHKGSIKVNSKPGRTEFNVAIPITGVQS
ncbi:MAG: ATP-binding protein [Spirochaetia bacterium]|nr:ATP-binding protein [Spirochaetia bacterium]